MQRIHMHTSWGRGWVGERNLGEIVVRVCEPVYTTSSMHKYTYTLHGGGV